jgi:hypothetical protein
MEFAEYVARQRPALMRFATQLGCRESTVRSQIHPALNPPRIDLTASAPNFQETS